MEYYSNWYPIIAGLGVFGWSFYKYPRFRRNVIETGFELSDQVYDIYYKYKYNDDSIKITIEDKFEHQNKLDLVNGSSNTQTESNDSSKKKLLDFYASDLNLAKYQLKEKTFYHIGNKSEFDLDNVLSLDWLSITIEIDDYQKEISDLLKQLWVKNNKLPFSLEYYDFWIRKVFDLEVENPKNIKLVIINEMGDFLEFSNVLILPGEDDLVISLPSIEN